MSQHDFVIENQGFAATRADINAALAALSTNSSGATEPATTYAFQVWADTTADRLKIRNAANDGWVSVFVLSTGSPLGGAASGDNNDITRLLALVEVPAVIAASSVPDVPQTVLSGPVDSNGFAAFGGTTGSATLTTTGTLRATCFAGSGLHRTGDITNAAFTSPAGTGTAFPHLEISAAGVVTTGVSSLPWIYQPGGTPSVTSGQHTVNYKEGKVYVGNGSVATQVYRVCIGECAHTSGSWSGSPIWHAIKGSYRSAIASPLFGNGVVVNFNHNLGVNPEAILGSLKFFAQNITPEQNWSTGSVIEPDATVDPSGFPGKTWGITSRNTASVCGGGYGTGWQTTQRTSGAAYQIDRSKWAYYVELDRGWK